VVEVDVGEEKRARLGAPEPVEQGVDARGGARVNDQAVQLVGADDPVAPQVEHVDGAAHEKPGPYRSAVREGAGSARTGAMGSACL
jgi:hypothetical protein